MTNRFVTGMLGTVTTGLGVGLLWFAHKNKKLNENLNHIDKETKSLTLENNDLRHIIEKNKGDLQIIKELEERVAEEKQQNAGWETTVNRLKEELEGLQAQINLKEEKNRSLDSSIGWLLQENKKKLDEVSKLKRIILELERKCSKPQSEKEKLELEISKLKLELAKAQRALKDNLIAHEGEEEGYKDSINEKEELINKIEDLKNENEKLFNQIEELKKENADKKKLKNDLAMKTSDGSNDSDSDDLMTPEEFNKIVDTLKEKDENLKRTVYRNENQKEAEKRPNTVFEKSENEQISQKTEKHLSEKQN